MLVAAQLGSGADRWLAIARRGCSPRALDGIDSKRGTVFMKDPEVWVPETLAGDFRKCWPVPVMVAPGRG